MYMYGFGNLGNEFREFMKSKRVVGIGLFWCVRCLEDRRRKRIRVEWGGKGSRKLT